MSDKLKNNFSSNFIFDQLIKHKIFEIEKMSQLSSKIINKRQNNDVIIQK
jgi:hypothetical protein